MHNAFLPAVTLAVAASITPLAASAQAAPAAASAASPLPATPRGTPAPGASATPTPATVPPGASPAPSASASATPVPTVSFSAYGDTGVTSIGGADAARFVDGTPSRIFDGSTGPFVDANGGRTLAPAQDFVRAGVLQAADLALQLNGPVVGAKFEGVFGTDADVLASNGLSRSGVNLLQAYVQAARGPATLYLGKFLTLAGAEVPETVSDYNYSRTYLFGYAEPFTHTGARLAVVVNPKLTVNLGVNNGWDDAKFVGKKETIEAGLSLTPTPGYALSLVTYNGGDFAANGMLASAGMPATPAFFSNREYYNGVLTVHPTAALTLIGNFDSTTQNASLVTPKYRFNGVSGYVNYQFTPQYMLSLRKETFHDDQGSRTGIAQRLQSSTATINYTPSAHYLFRAEYRLDTSDMNAFAYRGGATVDPVTGALLGRPHQSSLGAEAVLKL